ncbi:IS66 family insertion sequence element accessory protein TnpB [Anaerocolumna sp. AGMB13020]|uniref:IS66 family insertion sequence element accessory protein TnpA n=1 Tax=Anaerocolumna sp. AGMB13020 TaxID=3081750 RepID=UPI002955DB2F|nr:IS66 family insertion sequence element accessory protein TnpB [Anaerocolumna sp. AGMB13020]WOO35815.1 IS66 family insertion sequence element accessory protein TnpB [Anaerocolumna sp. AGMB13020]
MDEVTFVKTQFRKEQWKKLILECQSSDIKVEDWCASHDVTKHAYYYWLHKIREEACENLPAKREQAKSVPFKKLEVTSPLPNIKAGVIIHLSSATVEVYEGTSQQTVEAVLLALRNIC